MALLVVVEGEGELEIEVREQRDQVVHRAGRLVGRAGAAGLLRKRRLGADGAIAGANRQIESA